MTDAQARHLSRTVEDVFRLARADTGGNNLQIASLYLDEVLAEAVRNAAILGKSKGISVEMQEMSESPFRGDEDLLRQMALNLLENSIKYTPAGGKVRLSLDRLDKQYVITVVDTGIGIPGDARGHIFERFFRGDTAGLPDENRLVGAGLGLSIAKWIAEAHHGRLELRSSGATGSTFVASLPAS